MVRRPKFQPGALGRDLKLPSNDSYQSPFFARNICAMRNVIVACVGMLVGFFHCQANGFAESPSAQGAPCESARVEFCSKVKAGSGRIFSCLKQHEKKVSDACRKEMSRRSDRFELSLAGCDHELSTFCGKVQKGGGRILACLVEHHKNLSRTCRKSLDTFSW